MEEGKLYHLAKRSGFVKVLITLGACQIVLPFVLAVALADVMDDSTKYGPELIVGLLILWVLFMIVVGGLVSVLNYFVERSISFMLTLDALIVNQMGRRNVLPYAEMSAVVQNSGFLLKRFGLRAAWIDTHGHAAKMDRTYKFLKRIKSPGALVPRSDLTNFHIGLRYLPKEQAELLVKTLNERREAAFQEVWAQAQQES